MSNTIPPIPQKNFFKVWFGNGEEFTTGIILNKQEHGHLTLSQLSQMYPLSEAPKIKRFYRSPFYRTWEEAFTATILDVEYSARINR